jgi:hypothetical protein
VGHGLAFLDALLRRPALVVEANDGPVRPGQRGDDEPDPGEQLAEVMLDLGDDAARAVSESSLVLEVAVADQGRATRSAARPSQRILDLPLQHVIGRQPDRVAHSSPF